MFDISQFDFSFRPNLQLEDNAGRFWMVNDDDEIEEFSHSDLQPGMGVHERGRVVYLGEVEVAYMGIESTLSDLIWVTMHRDGNDYRLVFRSENPDFDEVQPFEPQFHSVPTFGELLYALDHVTLDPYGQSTPGWVQGTVVGITFSELGSEYYPQLEEWYFAVQDHFFMTGEMVYLDDSRGDKVRIDKVSEPRPERRAQTEPGSGSFFAASMKQPGLLGELFRPTRTDES
jgi:hypothetical protein